MKLARASGSARPRGSNTWRDRKKPVIANPSDVVNGVFYARLPKWDELADGQMLEGTEPHEIERLFFGHCRMEPAWSGFDFAVDVSATYAQKMAAVTAYESVFSGDQASLIDKYSAEDRYVGSLVGVQYAEAFKARSPLLVDSPDVFAKARFG